MGQSLVVPAVKKLAQAGIELTLVTFEKPADLQNADEMERVGESLAEDNIEWIPLKYHKEPKIPATVFDITNGAIRAISKRLQKKYDILHARTFIGGLIGVAVAPLIGAKFVYHNEGFYPDEQVDGGIWAEGSQTHRIAKRLEGLMYRRADGIIALSHRAKAILEKSPDVASRQTPVIFVPSCVDLERFHLPQTSPEFNGREIKLVYIGSVGGRYILDKIGAFVAAARSTGKDVTLQIFSKADKALIATMLDSGGLSRDAWRLEAVAYSEMPERLSGFHAGMFFLTSGISEHGCSPTKIGEYWAVGLPVITTPNVSDTDDIIKRDEVGAVIENHTAGSYLAALDEVVILLRRKNLAADCRRSAESHYALAPACKRQFNLYNSLKNRALDT